MLRLRIFFTGIFTRLAALLKRKSEVKKKKNGYLMTVDERRKVIGDMYILGFRGRSYEETLYVETRDGRRELVASAVDNGSSYSRSGIVLGEFIQKHFGEYLKRTSAVSLPGLGFRDAHRATGRGVWHLEYREGDIVVVDGSIGFGPMEKLLNLLGVRLTRVRNEIYARTCLLEIMEDEGETE